MIHDYEPIADAEGWPRVKCKVCGDEKIAWPGTDLTKVYPQCGEKPLGLGDSVAVFFAGLGIPECEGCAKRKELLNKLGEWFSQITA